MILSTLQPTPRRLALPPCPPASLENQLSSSTDYNSLELLPPSFICPLCSDVIVGAYALDCGCHRSTVCGCCWNKQAETLSAQLGFVWVEKSHCPSCSATVHSGVYCHALDVAILELVQRIPTESNGLAAMQRNYYERLSLWRAHMLCEQETQANQERLHQDEILAALIQEEERMIWENHRQKDRTTSRSTRNLIFLSLGPAMAMLAATIASIGVKTLVRK